MVGFEIKGFLSMWRRLKPNGTFICKLRIEVTVLYDIVYQIYSIRNRFLRKKNHKPLEIAFLKCYFWVVYFVLHSQALFMTKRSPGKNRQFGIGGFHIHGLTILEQIGGFHTGSVKTANPKKASAR